MEHKTVIYDDSDAMRLRSLPDFVLEYFAPMLCGADYREELHRRRSSKPLEILDEVVLTP